MARYRRYLVGRKVFEASTNKDNVGVACIEISEQEKDNREHGIGVNAFQNARVSVDGNEERRTRTELFEKLDSEGADDTALSNVFLRVRNWKYLSGTAEAKVNKRLTS